MKKDAKYFSLNLCMWEKPKAAKKHLSATHRSWNSSRDFWGVNTLIRRMICKQRDKPLLYSVALLPTGEAQLKAQQGFLYPKPEMLYLFQGDDFNLNLYYICSGYLLILEILSNTREDGNYKLFSATPRFNLHQMFNTFYCRLKKKIYIFVVDTFEQHQLPVGALSVGLVLKGPTQLFHCHWYTEDCI